MPDVQTAGNKVFRDHEVLGLLLGEDTAARLLPGHESSAEMEEDENERIRGRNPVLPNLPIVDAIVHDLGEETSGQIEEREVLDVVPEILHGHSSDRSSDHCSAISDYSAVDRSLPLSGPDTEGPAEKERRERGQIVGTREPVLPDVRIVDAIIHNQTEHLHEYIAQRSALGLDDALLHSDSEKPGNQNPAGGRKQTIDTRAPVLPDLPIADAIVHDQVEHPHEYIVSRSVHDVIDAVLHFPTPLRHDRSALVSRFEHDTGVVDAVMHGDGAKEKPNDHSAVGLGLPGSSVSTSAGGLSPQRIGTRSVCVAKTGLGHVELYKEALFLAVFFSICFIAVRIFMRFLKRDFDQLVYMEPEESGNGRKTADGEMREFGAGNEMSVAERGGAALSDDSCDEEWEEEEQVLIWVGGVIKSVRGTLGRVQRSVEKFDGRAVEGEGVEARV